MRPIVFFPGAGGRAEFWQPVASRLTDLGPATCIGYPGFGALPPEPGIGSLDALYRWALARLPAGPLRVVAQSMGGILAARLAFEHPDRVERLVLVATSAGVDLRGTGAIDWRPGYLASLPGVPRWFVDDRTDLTARLADIRAPTLLLWAEADPVSPVAVARALAARIPRARTVVVSGDSHTFAQERPDEVAALVREHLAPEARLVRVRPVTPGDADAVCALWRDVFPEYDDPSKPQRSPAAAIARKLAVRDGLFWLAERDDRIVGTAMAGYDGHRGWLYSVGVHLAARNAGIGRRLVAEAERALAALGCPKVNVQVFTDNRAARAFWQRLGYAVDDVVSLGRRLSG